MGESGGKGGGTTASLPRWPHRPTAYVDAEGRLAFDSEGGFPAIDFQSFIQTGRNLHIQIVEVGIDSFLDLAPFFPG